MSFPVIADPQAACMGRCDDRNRAPRRGSEAMPAREHCAAWLVCSRSAHCDISVSTIAPRSSRRGPRSVVTTVTNGSRPATLMFSA